MTAIWEISFNTRMPFNLNFLCYESLFLDLHLSEDLPKFSKEKLIWKRTKTGRWSLVSTTFLMGKTRRRMGFWSKKKRMEERLRIREGRVTKRDSMASGLFFSFLPLLLFWAFWMDKCRKLGPEKALLTD